jgi:hypothetical protein
LFNSKKSACALEEKTSEYEGKKLSPLFISMIERGKVGGELEIGGQQSNLKYSLIQLS